MRTVFLSEREIEALDRQNGHAAPDEGWDDLLARLRARVVRSTGLLHLDDRDLEQISRYASDVKVPGRAKRLRAVFWRAPGPKLGR